ncbi:GNAT family N-acetyltransferase [Halobacillus shinanisalinarum]|uniref:GNAT family N-acetyltransferase n=1 Tax=Halobacillus shinanisalinarum TaxID=2932258 RepID=A0ABY4H4D3_9BACI|nr:GNAT family N-acetyltransferase [Halobacillus shinanisalinarum]UOQ95321.1 GNAT family N-acetyltransferase [Halobacillus shinanisalinarum]
MKIKPFTNTDKDLEAIVEIYCQSFKKENAEKVLQTIIKHSTYEGFSGIKYVRESGKVLGFAYGYSSLPGQFYQGKLQLQLNAEERIQWLDNCFEFVELAVAPESRKRGIGRVLLDELLKTTSHATSILTTSTDNLPAIQFYKKNAWQVVKARAAVIPNLPPLVIMGKELTKEEVK